MSSGLRHNGRAGFESVLRLLNSVSVGFDQAIAIRGHGLGVNLGSAWLLRDDHGFGAGFSATDAEGLLTDKLQSFNRHNLRL